MVVRGLQGVFESSVSRSTQQPWRFESRLTQLTRRLSSQLFADLSWIPFGHLGVVPDSRGEFERDETRRDRQLIFNLRLFPALLSIPVLPVRQRWLRNHR